MSENRQVENNGDTPDGRMVLPPATVAPAPHKPTRRSRRLVKSMVAHGITKKGIADMLEMSEETLAKYYSRELETGLDEAVTVAARSLYRRGLKGDTAALTFWLRSRGKWKDRDAPSIQVATIVPESNQSTNVELIERSILKALASLRPAAKLIEAKVIDNQ